MVLTLHGSSLRHRKTVIETDYQKATNVTQHFPWAAYCFTSRLQLADSFTNSLPNLQNSYSRNTPWPYTSPVSIRCTWLKGKEETHSRKSCVSPNKRTTFLKSCSSQVLHKGRQTNKLLWTTIQTPVGNNWTLKQGLQLQYLSSINFTEKSAK